MRTFALTLVALGLVPGIPLLGLQGEEPNRLPIKIDKSVGPLIEEIATGPAFSLVYDGKRSQDLLLHWTRTGNTSSLGDGRELQRTVYPDEATGIEIARKVTLFPDAPAVECILRLHNAGTRDTPTIEQILPLELQLAAGSVGSLTRSEAECGGIPHPTATQVQTAELSLWIPMGMGTVNGFDPYVFRSAASNGVWAAAWTSARHIFRWIRSSVVSRS
jgi:hypothetical protein